MVPTPASATPQIFSRTVLARLCQKRNTNQAPTQTASNCQIFSNSLLLVGAACFVSVSVAKVCTLEPLVRFPSASPENLRQLNRACKLGPKLINCFQCVVRKHPKPCPLRRALFRPPRASAGFSVALSLANR